MDPADSSSHDDSSSSEHNDPVREAISTINDGNGVDIDGIYEFVKARHDLMPNYRDVLEVELNKRVSRNELEMVDNLYRIVHVSSDPATETEPEPVAVADPANTSSDAATSSGDTHLNPEKMVRKAISTLNGGNGANFDEICGYIKEEGYDLQPEHRELLKEYMDICVSENELEMVDNTRYKFVHVTSEDTHHETTETKSKSVELSDQKDLATSSSDYALPYGDMPEAMVLEAISTMDDGVGVDIDEIYEYIENRYKIPPDYMKILEDELKRRVSENELEKGEYGYKILDITSENMDEAQSKAVAVADQKDPANTSSSYAATSSGNAPGDAVLEAISTINDGNGVDIDGIYQFLEEKCVLPPNYRKQLEDGLKRRVSQYILEKVGTDYKILDVTPEKLHELTEAAAKAVAVSDQKDLEAKEASEAADRAKKVLEENELVLQVAKEALDRCTKGE